MRFCLNCWCSLINQYKYEMSWSYNRSAGLTDSKLSWWRPQSRWRNSINESVVWSVCFHQFEWDFTETAIGPTCKSSPCEEPTRSTSSSLADDGTISCLQAPTERACLGGDGSGKVSRTLADSCAERALQGLLKFFQGKSEAGSTALV